MIRSLIHLLNPILTRESLIGTEAVKNWEKHAARPLTRKGENLYLHLPQYTGRKNHKGQVSKAPEWKNNSFTDELVLKGINEPLAVTALHSGEKVAFEYDKSKRELRLKESFKRDPLMTVLKLTFKEIELR